MIILAGTAKDLVRIYSMQEQGQGLVEYALILVLVAVVVIVILALLGPAIGDLVSDIMDTVRGGS